MTLEQRIKNLMGSLIVRDDADLVHEIRGFLDILDDVAYREKIRSAIRWAEMYINPQQYAAWDSEAESGREAVRWPGAPQLGPAETGDIKYGDLR
jgi:hypothetical protein